MELGEWINLYNALAQAAGTKERGYWTIVGIFLVANCLLVFPLSFVFFSYTAGEGRYFVTVLAGIGVLMSLLWVLAQSRTAHELAHFEALLRSIEGQFAGAEFYRGLARLQAGEELTIPATTWRGKEWQADTLQFKRITRAPVHLLITFLPVVFGGGWIAIAIFSWVI